MKRLMITGGAGFIGSNFARYVLEAHAGYEVVVYDKLTYAGNPDNFRDLVGSPRFSFVQGDICDASRVDETMREHRIDTVVNFAAESHVDRSILDPDAFIQTDVYRRTRYTARSFPARSRKPIPWSPTAPIRPAKPAAS